MVLESLASMKTASSMVCVFPLAHANVFVTALTHIHVLIATEMCLLCMYMTYPFLYSLPSFTYKCWAYTVNASLYMYIVLLAFHSKTKEELLIPQFALFLFCKFHSKIFV